MTTLLSSITFLIASVIPQNYKYEKKELIASGENIVFKMKSEGIVITGSYEVEFDNLSYNPSDDSDIKKGDIITEVDGEKVLSINELTSYINSVNRSIVILTINRNNNIIKRTLKIVRINNLVRTGLYVKDRVLGVGTLTFIDPTTSFYGALGHEIIDSDVKTSKYLNEGSLYYNDVISIKKGENGKPGEKITNTEMKDSIGKVNINTNMGIFGRLKSYSSKYIYPMNTKNNIRLDKAYILTCIKGKEVKPYEIEIVSLKEQNIDDTKGITFKITDKELLSISGGVYSGMSGSPIIQNDHIIGAVTHVIVNDIQYGYGLYIENMYNKMIKSLK